jgi:hypothetical protein
MHQRTAGQLASRGIRVEEEKEKTSRVCRVAEGKSEVKGVGVGEGRNDCPPETS